MPKDFGILLTYSYLCKRNEERTGIGRRSHARTMDGRYYRRDDETRGMARRTYWCLGRCSVWLQLQVTADRTCHPLQYAFAQDARYSGLKSLIMSGDYFNANFGYHVMPKVYDVFDDAAFNANSMEFFVVCTDVETGKAVYQQLDTVNENTYDWIRASASMPLLSKVVELEGKKLLDGGVADSIPLEYFESIGYKHNVVILTQPAGYQKEHNRLMPLMRLSLRRYPYMVKALDERHIMYNYQLEYVAKAEHEGRCLVIRPDGKIPIGHISHNADEMRHVYEMGLETGERYIHRIQQFFDEK